MRINRPSNSNAALNVSASAGTDEELFQRFQLHNDQDAFAELVQRYKNFAFRIAYSVCGSNALVEDAVQDAFLHAARKNKTFQSSGSGSFRRWFYSLAINSAKMSTRTEVRKRKRINRVKEQAEQLDASNANQTTSVEDDEFAKELEIALGEIHPKYRTPIILHFLEGLTQTEIGRMTGISQAIISQQIAAGLKLLRKKLMRRDVVMSTAALTELLKNHSISIPLQLDSALGTLHQTATEISLNPVEDLGDVAAELTETSSTTTLIFAACTISVIAGGAYWFDLAGTKPNKVSNRNLLGYWDFEPEKSWVQSREGKIKHFGGTIGGVNRKANSGNPGAGAYAMGSMFFQIPVDDLPAKITFQGAPLPFKRDRKTVNVIHPKIFDDAEKYAEFFNLAPPTLFQNTNEPAWKTYTVYVTKEYMDTYADRERIGLAIGNSSTSHKKTTIQFTQPFLLDEIRIEKMHGEDLPKVEEYISALENIPAHLRFRSLQVLIKPKTLGEKTVPVRFHDKSQKIIWRRLFNRPNSIGPDMNFQPATPGPDVQFVEDKGLEGDGCLQTKGPQVFYIPGTENHLALASKLPFEFSYVTKFFTPSKNFDYLSWDSMEPSVVYQNRSQFSGTPETKRRQVMRFYVTAEYIDCWVDDVRFGVQFKKPTLNGRLLLQLNGERYVDDLIIRKIKPGNLPALPFGLAQLKNSETTLQNISHSLLKKIIENESLPNAEFRPKQYSKLNKSEIESLGDIQIVLEGCRNVSSQNDGRTVIISTNDKPYVVKLPIVAEQQHLCVFTFVTERMNTFVSKLDLILKKSAPKESMFKGSEVLTWPTQPLLKPMGSNDTYRYLICKNYLIGFVNDQLFEVRKYDLPFDEEEVLIWFHNLGLKKFRVDWLNPNSVGLEKQKLDAFFKQTK